MSLGPKRIIENANSILAQGNNRQLMQAFLEKFSQCEVYTRPVLIQYHKSIGEEVKPENICLNAREIKDAFSEQGIYFADGKILTRIFGAEDAPNKSSCRWLRNKVTHELMKRAINEVCERNAALINDMDDFIQQIIEQS